MLPQKQDLLLQNSIPSYPSGWVCGPPICSAEQWWFEQSRAWEPLHLLVLFKLPISCHLNNLVNLISTSFSPDHYGQYLILVRMTPSGRSPGQSCYICYSLPAALEGPAGSFQPKVLCYHPGFFPFLQKPGGAGPGPEPGSSCHPFGGCQRAGQWYESCVAPRPCLPVVLRAGGTPKHLPRGMAVQDEAALTCARSIL